MKPQMPIVWQADDGQLFETKYEAERHMGYDHTWIVEWVDVTTLGSTHLHYVAANVHPPAMTNNVIDNYGDLV